MSVQEAAVSLLERVLFYVGIDWGTERHAVCVMGPSGRVKTQFTIEHTAAGFVQLLRRLAELTDDPADLAVAIERPDGWLVDALLEAGHPVVPVSPNAIRTWRRGEVLSGAKSDAGDAVLIAEYLRLRAHRLQPAAPYSAQTKALRTVVRTREDVQNLRIAAVNQLGALLDAHWPGAKSIFTDIPLVGFLPADDERVRGTVAAIEKELLVAGYVQRYTQTPENTADGPPGEGAFLACTFWLADNYSLMGRTDEATELFERLLSLRNALGLLSEEYDPKAGRLVGNFPQAFSHVPLINTARNLSTRGGPSHQREKTTEAGQQSTEQSRRG